MLLFVLRKLLQDQGLVVRVKHLEVGLGVVDLILGLNCVELTFELNEGAVLLLDEDDLADSPEVGEDIVYAVMVIVLGKRPREEYF
jgi:hypothetical protein